MNWIDLHCDTPLRLYKSREKLSRNTLHLDTRRTAPFGRFLQCAALFCPADVPDEKGFSFILSAADYFEAQIKETPAATLVRTRAELYTAWNTGKRAFLFTVEDARILNRNIDRISLLYSRGVRIITPLWRGVSAIGGAHDTDVGLSAFGKDAVETMVASRILPDVSHASEKSFLDIHEITTAAGLPLIATHSCAAALCPHTRNLTDTQIRKIAEGSGVVGLNFYPPFLKESGKAELDDIFSHLRHLFRIGGKELPALGTDFDGINTLPRGICGIEDMERVYTEIKRHGFTESEADCFFSGNAERILKAIL